MQMEATRRRIQSQGDHVAALCSELIRFPTVNPPGEAYEPCARYLGARLARSGFEVEYLRARGTPGDSDIHPRINVIGRREGGLPGATVHFNSHIDVVEAGEDWTMDPFAGILRDGRVYGRGACDMKGGLAASIIAVECFLAEHPRFPGAIEISGTADEESGGFGGVAYLAGLGRFSRPRVDHVIIPEPLDKHRICLGHRGVWWAEIETKGEIAHGSMPFLGDCAVRHMGAVLAAFERDLFPKLTTRTTAMPVVPEGARRSTLNINSIHGGQSEPDGGLPAPNVPDSCRIVIDRRYLIEEDPAEMRREVTSILEELRWERPKFNYRIRDLMNVEPLMTDRGSKVASALAHAISDVLGREPDYVVSPGTYDQKHIARIGGLEECVAYGPGRLDLAHRPDEWVGIDDMLQSAEIMAVALSRLLNGAA
jgi:succinyl-diaminopimelate desuccinylase